MTLLTAILILAAALVGLGATAAGAATSGEFSGRLTFRLSAIDPVVVTADGPGSVTLVGRYTNTGPDPIDDIEFRFQRGAALTTPAAVQDEIAEPSQPADVVGKFRPLPGSVEPGHSTPFAITVPVFEQPTGNDDAASGNSDGGSASSASLVDSLGITEPGVYPVMLNLNATVHVGDASARARVGEVHVLVTVASVPDSIAGVGGARPAGAATPVNILWPLADRPHLGVGDVFADDDLAAEITDGGRLATALTALEEAAPDPELLTVVVDPMLLDELERMAGGYRVLAHRDSVQARLRPDGVVPGTVAGAGQAAATDYLQRLRALAATHRVLVLPYGDADLSALTRAGMTDEATEAVSRGRDVGTRVLVRGPQATAIYRNLVTDIAAPPGGMMTEATLSLLAGLGDHAAVLAPGAVATSAGKTVTDGLVAFDRSATGYDAVRGVVAGGERADQFGEILAGTLQMSTAEAVNELAADFWTTPAARRTPIIVAPPRQFTPSPTGLVALSHLVDTLTVSRTLVPTSLPALLGNGAAARAATPVTPDYSAAARSAELPLAYLRRIQDVHRQIDTVRQSLSKADGADADPRDVTDALADALVPAVSSTWRMSADPAASRLETIDATLVWLYGGVQIARDAGSYTLASSTAPLLLTLRNTLPYQVTVNVAIVGGQQAGLQATDPGPVTIGAGPRSTPVKLETVVSRSGTFTVYAQLYGTDGAQWSAPMPLTIASRAYGALTVILMATAGGVLVLMVIWRLVQRLRGRIDDPGNRRIEPQGGVDSEVGEADAVDAHIEDAGSDDPAAASTHGTAPADPDNAAGARSVIPAPPPPPEGSTVAREGS
jgi:hypothetical protein